MSVPDPTGTTIVELSRAEQWVVHHVLLESLGLADGETSQAIEPDDPPQPSLVMLEKLEAGSFEFTGDELRFLRQACADHADSTQATADRNLASSVADRIDAVEADRALRSE